MAINEKYPSPDIYNINAFINAIKKDYISGVDEDTLMLGTFGYFGQIMSDMFQNSIVMASEFSNESIATKAKFEKNIIAHALGLGITDINAKPAQMNVFLIFLEQDIINWANVSTANKDELPWKFVFDKNSKILFGEYEFHTDYDIIIKKVEVSTQGTKKRFAYTAQYDPKDFAVKNPVSPVGETNPYLRPPVCLRQEGRTVIMVQCRIRQVEKETQYTKILADNDIAAKTITFTFSGQLAGFSLDVTEGNETYHMIPVYEGLNVDTKGQFYFWYTYLNSNTIRIKFDRASKMPKVNASVQINLQTTQGAKGNFNYQYKTWPTFNFESERLNYSNISCGVRPIEKYSTAVYGTDKKSIEELKRIIPKEALSRGSITNLADLNNHFNSLDDEFSKLYFYKKRDNCLERLYYSYMIMRDSLNIVPTNTVNLKMTLSDLSDEADSNKLILKQGQLIILNPTTNEARLYQPGEPLPDEDPTTYDGSFAYYLPYNFIINKSPLYGQYILTSIHDTRQLDFSYINENCVYQYISTEITWDRNCLEDHDKYRLRIDLMQNVVLEDSKETEAPIRVNEEGETICDLAVYMIIYNEKGKPLRWAKADLVELDTNGTENGTGTATAIFQFEFSTKDYIDNENRIRINTGIYDIGTNYESYAHFNENMQADIFVLSKQEDSYGLGENPSLDTIIPGLEGFSLSNTYSIMGGINFFYDYSSIVSSIVTLTDDLVIVPPEDPNPPDPPDSDDPPVDPMSQEQIRADIDYLYAMEIIPNEGEIDPYRLGLLYYSKYWNLNRIQSLYFADKLTLEEVEDILKNGINIPIDPDPIEPDPPVVDPDPPVTDPENPDYYPPGFDINDPSVGNKEEDAKFTGQIKEALTEKIPGMLEEILLKMEEMKKGLSNNEEDEDQSTFDDSESSDQIVDQIDQEEQSENRLDGAVGEEGEFDTQSIEASGYSLRQSNVQNRSGSQEYKFPELNVGKTIDPGIRESLLADPTIYYSPYKVRADIDFIYALRVSDETLDIYELANKYYPIHWDASKINSLVMASRLTKDEASALLGYTGDGSDRPIPDISNANEKDIRSDIDFLYALDIIQDPDRNAYELAKAHRPDEWSNERIESLYFADKLTKDQVIYLLGYAPIKPGEDQEYPGDEVFVPDPVYEHVTTYHVVGVPVVKFDYFTDEEVAKGFFRELIKRKNYIDDAIIKLEDAFEMDFKFFNTYGPSRFFTWDNGTDVVDRVNISLFFKLKLKPNYDTNIVEDIRKDIKEYIEDINKIDSLHIPNLITYITNRYRDFIVYFEFVSINGFPAEYQHIYAMDVPDGIMVPEFININTLSDGIPDIEIQLV